MSDPHPTLHPNADDAVNDVSGAVSNDEETRLDAPLPPSSHGPNASDDEGHVPGDAPTKEPRA